MSCVGSRRRSSAHGKAPERCHLGRARRVERVGFVGRPGMFRPHIASIHDLQPCRVERGEQLRPRPQAQVLREIRKDQPALAALAPGARAARPGIRAACGSRGRRSRARWESSAAREPRAGCTPRARRAPRGKRSACTTSTCPANPRRARFSRAHASARGSWSVATTRSMPRRASTAASTPVPVPMSKATLDADIEAGSGAVATRSTYSPANRREHSVVRMDSAADRRDFNALACATRARR